MFVYTDWKRPVSVPGGRGGGRWSRTGRGGVGGVVFASGRGACLAFKVQKQEEERKKKQPNKRKKKAPPVLPQLSLDNK